MLTCTVPAFPADPAPPVEVGTWDHVTTTAAREVARRVTASGYALIHAAPAPGPGAAASLAAPLGLGPAFTPPQYRGHAYVDGHGVIRITSDATTANHPAFGQ